MGDLEELFRNRGKPVGEILFLSLTLLDTLLIHLSKLITTKTTFTTVHTLPYVVHYTFVASGMGISLRRKTDASPSNCNEVQRQSTS